MSAPAKSAPPINYRGGADRVGFAPGRLGPCGGAETTQREDGPRPSRADWSMAEAEAEAEPDRLVG